MQTTSSFEGETVIVTGSARGIGQACVVAFVERGGTVIGGDLRDQSQTKAACADAPGRFEPIEADVTEQADVRRLVEAASDTGRIDVLVNAAGIVRKSAIGDHSDGDWEDSLEVNLSGPFRLIRAAIPALREDGGRIVNISSIYGQIGAAERASYASSKSGLEGLTRALAAELGPDDVRVNAVAPGFIETPMTEPYLDDKEAIEEFQSITALDRLGDPDEVASVVVFLSGEGASYVTGETILVDGGRATIE
jgi:NAD(P)-dependent dehydrogenase (short-subunit alcohol dehydrogenase family)